MLVCEVVSTHRALQSQLAYAPRSNEGRILPTIGLAQIGKTVTQDSQHLVRVNKHREITCDPEEK